MVKTLHTVNYFFSVNTGFIQSITSKDKSDTRPFSDFHIEIKEKEPMALSVEQIMGDAS